MQKVQTNHPKFIVLNSQSHSILTGNGKGDGTEAGGNAIKTVSNSYGSGLSSILINQQVKYILFCLSLFCHFFQYHVKWPHKEGTNMFHKNINHNSNNFK